jgi:hypothetical protein
MSDAEGVPALEFQPGDASLLVDFKAAIEESLEDMDGRNRQIKIAAAVEACHSRVPKNSSIALIYSSEALGVIGYSKAPLAVPEITDTEYLTDRAKSRLLNLSVTNSNAEGVYIVVQREIKRSHSINAEDKTAAKNYEYALLAFAGGKAIFEAVEFDPNPHQQVIDFILENTAK